MKKSIIAVAVVGALAVGYIGASWYTGNIIEDKIENKLTQVMDKVNNNQDMLEVNIQYSDYQKGIFSTTFHLTVNGIRDKDSIYEEEFIIFDDNITIGHGPLPFSRLKSGKFSPVMAAIAYEMSKEANEDLWEIAGNKPFITMDSTIDYAENIAIDIKNEAINTSNKNEYDEDEDTFIISAGKAQITTDKLLKQLAIDTHLDHLTCSKNNETITLDNFTLQLNGKDKVDGYDINFSFDKVGYDEQYSYRDRYLEVKQLKYLGEAFFDSEQNYNVNNNLIIDKMSISSSDSPALVANQLSWLQNDTIDGKNILSGESTINLDSLMFSQQNLGKGTFQANYHGLPVYLADNFLPFSDILSVTEQNDNTEVNTKEAEININQFLWQTEEGDLDAVFHLKLAGENISEKIMDQLIDEDDVDHFDSKINLPLDVVTHIITKIRKPDAKEITVDDIANVKNNLIYLTFYLFKSPLLEMRLDNENDSESGVYADIYYSKSEQRARVNGKELEPVEFFELLDR